MASYKSSITKVLRLDKDTEINRGEKRNISNVSMSSSSDISEHFSTSTPITGTNTEYIKTSVVLEMFDSINERLKKLDVLDNLCERMDNIESKLAKLEGKCESMEDSLMYDQGDIAELRKSINELKVKPQTPPNRDIITHMQVKLLKEELDKVQKDNKGCELILSGIPEHRGEDCVSIVSHVLGSYIGIPNPREGIAAAHRQGPRHGSAARPIIVMFTSLKNRNYVFENRRQLAGSKIWIYPSTVDPGDSLLVNKVVTLAKTKDTHAKRIGQSILYKGKKYDTNTILSSDLQVHKLHSVTKNGQVQFLGKYCPLSNFYRCNFRIEGEWYTSVEQFYQFQKAKRMNDVEIAAKIKMEDDPKAVKHLSKQSRDFRGDGLPDSEWATKTMRTGLEAKFSQVPSAKTYLQGTGELQLIEANHSDQFWSCGYGLNDPRIDVQNKWRGKNMLGKLLMDVRKELAR